MRNWMLRKSAWYRPWLFLGAFLLAYGLRGAELPTTAAESVSIMLGPNPSLVQQFAAEELAKYLRMILGQEIKVGDAKATHRIYINDIPRFVPSAAAKRLRQDLDGLAEDGFVVRKVGSDVVVVGKGPRGSLYGCYAFLERLGVRWFFPGWEHEVVPRRKLDWGAPLDLIDSPVVRERILFLEGYSYFPIKEWIDFAAKARLNRFCFLNYHIIGRHWYINLRNRLLPECQKRGLMIETGSHLLSSFLPRGLFKDHPDWFRLNEQGQRTNDFNLNPFNSAALDYLTSHAVEYLEKMPESSLFHLWPDDIQGGGWTHEPGKEEYTPSDQSLLVANDIVQRLRKGLPNANLAFLAYHDTVFPPRVVKPEPGIIFFYAPRERCYGHALNDPKCSLNQKYSQALEKALPTFGSANAEVFEYYVDEILFENLTNPPLADVIAEDTRYYHRLGIPRLGALVVNTGEYVAPAVNMFLYPQALWNPHRDLNKSLAEYAANYFGDANLVSYFQELTRGLRDLLQVCNYVHPGDAWDSLRVDKESDEALAYHVEGMERGLRGPLDRADFLLEAALHRATRKLYRERLERERVSMRFTLLQARLYYHLLKGEWQYRIWKNRKEAHAGLVAAGEWVLALFTHDKLNRFLGRYGVKGQPFIPNPAILGQRTTELGQQGYSLENLYYRFPTGITGYIMACDAGARAVLWTDVASPHVLQPPAASNLVWEDEFGERLDPRSLDLFASPVVVEAQGMSPVELFDALEKSQPNVR